MTNPTTTTAPNQVPTGIYLTWRISRQGLKELSALCGRPVLSFPIDTRHGLQDAATRLIKGGASLCVEMECSVHCEVWPLALALAREYGLQLNIAFDPRVFNQQGPATVGTPLDPATTTEEALQDAYHAVLQERFAVLENLDIPLGRACVEGLKARAGKILLTDGFLNGKTLSGGMLLALGWQTADWLRKHAPEPRVGILLPPGIAGMVANLACALCGKTPVNFNPTTGREAAEACLALSGVTSIVTTPLVQEKLPNFPWPAKRLDISAHLKQLPKVQILWKRLLVSLLPASLLTTKKIRVPASRGDAEAALLFTSGSVGQPKAVVLTHRNILGNIRQTQAVLPPQDIPSILGCLPIFHSFGFTVTIWWPLISGPPIVSTLSPLDTARVIETIQHHQVALLVTTPTFLRTYTRKARPEQLRSLTMVVTGAEKLPADIRTDFEEKFNVPVCEGYGATETTPVIAVNRVFPHLKHQQIYSQPGTVGRLIPGLRVKTTDPLTGRPSSFRKTGVLSYKGVNIFAGYLGNPEQTGAVLEDGWYSSGDLGHLDENGFLHVEGRLSRFSKIAGEMVPHGTVELKLRSLLEEMLGREAPGLVVTGVQNPAKGESLVVLITEDVDIARLKKIAAGHGLPNLWIPRTFKKVAEVPLLASGKLDLQKIRKLAED
jgi:acyl-[acyl-carrier-protein]-phospholipid O-acyltransferase/long-chain-fatty-acid--[acyl-carrier-protein] ligase